MQPLPTLVIREGKRQAFVFQRKATKLSSESRSFLGMQCMHFPNTRESDTSLHPGHITGKQITSQLQSLSPCLLRLTGSQRHSVCSVHQTVTAVTANAHPAKTCCCSAHLASMAHLHEDLMGTN